MKICWRIAVLVGAAALGGVNLVIAYRERAGTSSCIGRRVTRDFDPSAVDRIEIGGDSPVVLSKGERAWGVDSRWGYPAEPSKVREVLILMSELKVGQSAPGMTNDCLKTVKLMAGGHVVSELLIGHARESGGRYVKFGDEMALVNDSLSLFDQPVQTWLQPRIMSLRGGIVSAIRFANDGGEVSMTQTNGTWNVLDMGDDEEMAADKAVQKIHAARMSLFYLDFKDIADPSLGDVACGFTNRTTFATRMWNGVEYTVRVGGAVDDGGRYVRLSAEALPVGANVVASAEALAEAKEFNSSRSRWTYVIPEALAENVIRSRDDFVTKKKQEEKK